MSFRSILVDIDSAATAQPALDCAVRLARITGARLHVVDAFSGSPESWLAASATTPDNRRLHKRDRLAAIARALHPVKAHMPAISGTGVEAIVRQVTSESHDLVVRSRARDLVESRGGVADGAAVQLIRRCPCTVWVVGSGTPSTPVRIVAAVDANRDDAPHHRVTLRVLDIALQLAALGDGTVGMLYAWQPSYEQQVREYATSDEYGAYLDSVGRTAEARLRRLADVCGARLAGVRLEPHRGPLQDVLPRFVVAEGVDVVVIGTMARARIMRRWLPSTVERLMTRLPCSIVAVKAG